MGEYRNLAVFQKAHAVTCDIYRATNRLPPRERFGLIDQIRRAGASIGANLAEGCGRNTDGELAHHVSIALGSANELTYLLELATDTEILRAEKSSAWKESVIEVRRMLASFLSSVQADRRTTRRASQRKASAPPVDEDAALATNAIMRHASRAPAAGTEGVPRAPEDPLDNSADSQDAR